ncbi:hypothetical protein [Streptomyces sp. NPDC026589]|uniref:MmyB family transcriptional regulator n=1 Tax=Streptomyces sp. NPDC026589 TaxID=3155609 RepID=UPI0033D25138
MGRAPRPPLLSPITPDVPDDLRDIGRLPFPALLEGPGFGILAYNRRAARACPWTTRPGANVMVDLLLPGPGRDQCAQWEEHWAPPLLAQLRQGALANSALRTIVDRVCEDPQVRELWHRTADLRRHTYGTTRPMHLDGWRPRPAWSESWDGSHSTSRPSASSPENPPAFLRRRRQPVSTTGEGCDKRGKGERPPDSFAGQLVASSGVLGDPASSGGRCSTVEGRCSAARPCPLAGSWRMWSGPGRGGRSWGRARGGCRVGSAGDE